MVPVSEMRVWVEKVVEVEVEIEIPSLVSL